jgi:hypothetical protein
MDCLSTNTLRPRHDIGFHALGEEAAVLFDPAQQRVFVLDRAEALGWCLLAESGGLEDAARELAAASETPPDEARRWLSAAAAQWAEAGLLGEAPPAAAPVEAPPAARVAEFEGGPVRRRYRALDRVVEVAGAAGAAAAPAEAALGALRTEAPAGLRCAVLQPPDGPWTVVAEGREPVPIPRPGQRVPALKLALTLLALDGARGVAAVHAAAVSRGGRGVLLPAPAGSGKSTLAAGCVLAGWELVADDTTVLEEPGLLRPLPLALCLKEGSWPALRRTGFGGIEALATHERLDGRLCRYLPAPRAAAPPVRLAAVVAPRWSEGARPELRRLSPREGFEALLPQLYPLAGALTSEAIGRVAALVGETPCFALGYDAMADGLRLMEEALAP